MFGTGDYVKYKDGSIWFHGKVVSVNYIDNKCLVHIEGYEDHWVPFDMLQIDR